MNDVVQLHPPQPAPNAGDHQGDIGYRGHIACHAARITYRQLDYWARTGLVEPRVRTANGSGTQRLYAQADIVLLRVIKRLIDTGVSLTNIRAAVRTLEAHDVEELFAITLLSDGTSIYALTTPDGEQASTVIDLLNEGRAVFGIVLRGVVDEVAAQLVDMPSERAQVLR